MKGLITAKVPESKLSNRAIPGWMALILGFFVWLVGIPLGHGVVPWAISLLAPHYGWIDGRPGIWNLLGLIPIVVGTACLIWIMVVGFAEIPESVELKLTPNHLLIRGPYTFTRNPMYVAELGLWLGWTVFYGSLPVSIGFVALCVVVSFVVLPREERALEARFGDTYREYKAKKIGRASCRERVYVLV